MAILIQEKERKKVAQTLEERVQDLENRVAALEGGYSFFIEQTREIHRSFEMVRKDLGGKISDVSDRLARLESKVQALEDSFKELPSVLARMIIEELDERDIKLYKEVDKRDVRLRKEVDERDVRLRKELDARFAAIDKRFDEVLALLRRQ